MMRRSRRPGPNDEDLLVALADRLRHVAAGIKPRADFQSSLRTSLTMEASTALLPDPAQTSVSAARTVPVLPRRRMAVATAVVTTALGLGGMASASASALPGEGLYPVKRATEQVELAFHRDLGDRGAFKLELAERRLDEARALSRRGPEFEDLAEESVREFEEAAADGTADLMAAFQADNTVASMTLLSRFTKRTDARLDDLASELPTESSGVVDSARESLQDIDSRTDELCATCDAGSEEPQPSPPADTGGSAEPEPEPEGPPPDEQPVAPAPAPPAPAPSAGSSSSVEDEDEQDDEDEDEDESESDEVEPDEVEPVPAPSPSPTPEPTPSPSPEPTPTPSPEPTDPTEPPTVLDIVPETIEGVGGLLEGTLGVLDLGQPVE